MLPLRDWNTRDIQLVLTLWPSVAPDLPYLLHKKTHKRYLSISQFVFINSKKGLYRAIDSHWVLIIFFLHYWFIHSLISMLVCVGMLQWLHSGGMGLQDMHSSTIRETISFMQPLCPGVSVWKEINNLTPTQTQKTLNITKLRGSFPSVTTEKLIFLFVFYRKYICTLWGCWRQADRETDRLRAGGRWCSGVPGGEKLRQQTSIICNDLNSRQKDDTNSTIIKWRCPTDPDALITLVKFARLHIQCG